MNQAYNRVYFFSVMISLLVTLDMNVFCHGISHISSAVTKSLQISSLMDSEVTASGQVAALSLGLW